MDRHLSGQVKLITHDEYQDIIAGKTFDPSIKHVGSIKRKDFYPNGNYGNNTDAPPSCGHGHDSTCNVPQRILNSIENNNGELGIDQLALGKPCGDIFPPDHFFYDAIRDHFASILDYSVLVEVSKYKLESRT